MTGFAKTVLVGQTRESILASLSEIEQWQNGDIQPIIISDDAGHDRMDSIENVRTAVKTDLAGYVQNNFGSSRTITKTGGKDEVFLVPNPDVIHHGRFKKYRRKLTNLTPKKKKRK